MGVNDFGDLVGYAATTDTGAHGFLLKHQNTITYFNTAEAGPNSDIHTVAMSVNKALIVGGADWFFSDNSPERLGMGQRSVQHHEPRRHRIWHLLLGE